MLINELFDDSNRVSSTPPDDRQPRKYTDIELSQIDKRVIPVAIDDWLLFAVDPSTQELWFTVMEMWPEWLDYDIDPSDMGEIQYIKTALSIFKQRRSERLLRTGWVNVKDDFIRSELENAHRQNITPTNQWWSEIEQELRLHINELKQLIAKQRPMIQKFWYGKQ